MKFDNERTVEKLQALKKLYAIVVLAIIGLFYTTSLDIYTYKYLGLTKQTIAIVLVIAYLLYYLYHLSAKTSFISYTDDGYKIVVRFYAIKPINPKKNSIEIPKNQFYKYTIERTLITEEVILYQKNGKQISKYPPFSIKGLNKEEKTKLFDSLDLYVQE
ncbi:MAG: hypothetical protein AB9846_08115 [Tenuifilaceae bacterium]